jgi:hypothetical protein
MVIENYDWVDRYFRRNPRIPSAMDDITATKEKRMYTFYLYKPTVGILEKQNQQEPEKTKLAPPKVTKSKKRY